MSAGIIHQYVAHEAGGDREEMRTALPLNRFGLVNKAQIHLVDQCCGLQGLISATAAEVCPGKRVQLRLRKFL